MEATAFELDVVDELAEYMAYCCAIRGNRETTVAGKLVTVNFFHEQWVGRTLLSNYFQIKAVKEGKKRRTRGGHPTTGEEAAVVGDDVRSGRGDQGVGSGRESSVDRASIIMPGVTEGVRVVR